MPDVIVRTRENGPILITGPITLTDHLGQQYDLTDGNSVALCRCTHSSKRPFCDGSHKRHGFCAAETVPPPVVPPS